MTLGALQGIAGIIVLAITAWTARRGTSQWRGVLLGIAAGAAASLVVGFALGFLTRVLPLNQFDYWLASLLSSQH